MSQSMEIRHLGIIICVIIFLPYWEHWDAFAFGGIIILSIKHMNHNFCFSICRLIIFLNYIFLFRGLWGAIDEWTDDFIPDQPRNFVTTACIAVILLIALGCFNTTSSRGARNSQGETK